MGYAVTNLGAQRLLHRMSLGQMTEPLDIEIETACVEEGLECLEVNPPLIGVFRPYGPILKVSDVDPDLDGGGIMKENPMGERSVKNLLETILQRPATVD